jgi:hypothetical protein
MANATFEDHPTDPDKVILRKKPRIDQGPDYERGFIDGMQYQMQSSVDKAVNAMAQPEQKPVAWLYIEPDNPHLNVHYDDVDVSQFPHDEWFPVYKSSPQRTWVGLTDEDMTECIVVTCNTDDGTADTRDLIRAVEAKLKDKNT